MKPEIVVALFRGRERHEWNLRGQGDGDVGAREHRRRGQQSREARGLDHGLPFIHVEAELYVRRDGIRSPLVADVDVHIQPIAQVQGSRGRRHLRRRYDGKDEARADKCRPLVLAARDIAPEEHGLQLRIAKRLEREDVPVVARVRRP